MSDDPNDMNARIRRAAGRKRITAEPKVPEAHRLMGARLRAAAGRATDEDRAALDAAATKEGDR